MAWPQRFVVLAENLLNEGPSLVKGKHSLQPSARRQGPLTTTAERGRGSPAHPLLSKNPEELHHSQQRQNASKTETEFPRGQSQTEP